MSYEKIRMLKCTVCGARDEFGKSPVIIGSYPHELTCTSCGVVNKVVIYDSHEEVNALARQLQVSIVLEQQPTQAQLDMLAQMQKERPLYKQLEDMRVRAHKRPTLRKRRSTSTGTQK